jgi:hypothetical protein
VIGISNRGDLRALQNDMSLAGEARFIYALTAGAGDDPSAAPLDMTVIFEYRQPLLGRTIAEVAALWHSLGAHAAFDESFNAELEKVMSSFTAPGLEPDRPLGSSISQIRTNEREFDWAWDLRQYGADETGFHLTSLDNTPDGTLNGSQQLGAFLSAKSDAILAGQHVLPTNLEGGAVGVLNPWNVTSVPTSVVQAFAAQTCNGCHSTNPLDTNFHMSPHKAGTAKLSPFLNNVADPTKDELSKRAVILQAAFSSAN